METAEEIILPKIIHFVWVGGNDLYPNCMETVVKWLKSVHSVHEDRKFKINLWLGTRKVIDIEQARRKYQQIFSKKYALSPAELEQLEFKPVEELFALAAKNGTELDRICIRCAKKEIKSFTPNYGGGSDLVRTLLRFIGGMYVDVSDIHPCGKQLIASNIWGIHKKHQLFIEHLSQTQNHETKHEWLANFHIVTDKGLMVGNDTFIFTKDNPLMEQYCYKITRNYILDGKFLEQLEIAYNAHDIKDRTIRWTGGLPLREILREYIYGCNIKILPKDPISEIHGWFVRNSDTNNILLVFDKKENQTKWYIFGKHQSEGFIQVEIAADSSLYNCLQIIDHPDRIVDIPDQILGAARVYLGRDDIFADKEFCFQTQVRRDEVEVRPIRCTQYQLTEPQENQELWLLKPQLQCNTLPAAFKKAIKEIHFEAEFYHVIRLEDYIKNIIESLGDSCADTPEQIAASFIQGLREEPINYAKIFVAQSLFDDHYIMEFYREKKIEKKCYNAIQSNHHFYKVLFWVTKRTYFANYIEDYLNHNYFLGKIYEESQLQIMKNHIHTGVAFLEFRLEQWYNALINIQDKSGVLEQAQSIKKFIDQYKQFVEKFVANIGFSEFDMSRFDKLYTQLNRIDAIIPLSPQESSLIEMRMFPN